MLSSLPCFYAFADLLSQHQYIEILSVCLCVYLCMCLCVCVTKVGCSGGGTTVVTCNLHTYTLYCADAITRGHTQGAAAEMDTIGEQQAKANAIREQQLKRMQWGAAAGADAIGVESLSHKAVGASE